MKNSSLGWYIGTVKEYDKEKDEAGIQFDVEMVHTYKYCVAQEFTANRLKLSKSTTRKLEGYEEIFEIGARVDMKWNKEELSETEWPAGTKTNEIDFALCEYIKAPQITSFTVCKK